MPDEQPTRVEPDNAIPVIGQFAPDTEMPLRREDWHYGAIRMGRRWYATRFHPNTEDNDGDLPEVGDTEFWENGKWHPYSIAAFQEREREAGLLGLARDESSTEGGAQPKPNPETLGSTDAAQADLGSTEGGARPGDTPLNDTRTNSDRPWREDVARAFVTNRPAQPEGAGEARVKARKPDQDDLRMLRDMAEPNWATGLNPGQKAVIGRVLDALGVYGPAPSTPTEEEGA